MKKNLLKEFEELFANYTDSDEEKQIFLDFIERVYLQGYDEGVKEYIRFQEEEQL